MVSDDRNCREVRSIHDGISENSESPGVSPLHRRLLMFSGGRDSTLAAVRLAQREAPFTLVTISSGHLVGLDRVSARLREIAPLLAEGTSWYHVRQPTELHTDTSFYEQTCLPCHHAYVVVSGILARMLGASRLAFGYVGYQQDWPEQTQLAISRLSQVLARHGIILELPVYDVTSKEAAVAEMAALGLNTAALEQKCLRQVTNVMLPEARLRQQIALWGDAIERSLEKLGEIAIEIVEMRQIGEFR